METCLVLSKFFIVVYSSLTLISDYSGDLKLAVLFILIFMAANIVMYIPKNINVRKIIIILSMVASIWSSYFMDSVFILLLPLSLCEIISLLQIKTWLGISINIISLFFIDGVVIKEYILAASLSYIICFLSYNNSKQIVKLVKEKDDLKNRNYLLAKKLSDDLDYQMQIKYTSQIEERNKIAQEIHDNIGHTISGSLMQLEAINFIMDKNHQKAKEMLQNTIGVLREGMESIRATLRNIKPPPEQVGINKVKLMLSEFQVTSSIEAELYFDKNLQKISHYHWKIINDCLKEALTNTLKYSKASKLKVKIQILNKFIKVEIKDNGLGNLKIKKGLGILGIEERCENVNGKVIVDGSNGFSIIMLLPI